MANSNKNLCIKYLVKIRLHFIKNVAIKYLKRVLKLR